MSSKLFSKSGVFLWSPQGIEENGLLVADFAQYFDPSAAVAENRINFLNARDLMNNAQPVPSVSAISKNRFNELAWSNLISQDHPSGIIAGGTEDGTVVTFDAQKFLKNGEIQILSSRKDHHGHVLTIDVSRDGRWMASGGGSGDILLWDVTNLATPFSPGSPNYQQQVKFLKWNLKTDSIFTSITSSQASCWDLRRNGSPVLEFAEIGQGCDWSSLAWCPTDASQLLLASQSQNCSIIQKWDLRYTSAPIKEYRHHNFGITSLDWNRKDDRLIVSAGCDAQVIIWNHESGELLGGVGSLQGDWIRSVKWNDVDPNQLGIQYFQQPIQIASISSLGQQQPGAEVLAARIVDTFIPAWTRAPLIGASVSLGGKLATYWKSFDSLTQQWVHNVEVEMITQNSEIVLDVQEFVHNKEKITDLAWYMHELAYKQEVSSETEAMKRMVWLFIMTMLDGRSRKKLLQHLDQMEDQKDGGGTTDVSSSSGIKHVLGDLNTTSTSIDSVTTSTSAVTATTTTTESTEQEDQDDEENEGLGFIEKMSTINWEELDKEAWDFIKYTIENNHRQVVQYLLKKKEYMAAMMYAAKNEQDMMEHVFEKYVAENNQENDVNKLVSTLCFKKASKEVTNSNLTKMIESFPDDEWKILLAMLITTEKSADKIKTIAKFIGLKWLEKGYELRSCIAFALAGDVDNLMRANKTSFSLDERVKQGFALSKSQKDGFAHTGGYFEQALVEYGQELLKNGLAEMAWKLLTDVTDPKSVELIELKHVVFCAAGGRDCTGDQPPKNPWISENGAGGGAQQTNNKYNPQQSQPPPPPDGYNRRQANIAPMPPSSMFYQTPSWDHKPPAASAAPPAASGWNDPPQMTPSWDPRTPAVPAVPVAPLWDPRAPAAPPAVPSWDPRVPQQPSQPLMQPPSPPQVIRPIAVPAAAAAVPPAAAGWNDPPPLTQKKQEQKVNNVMQVNWKPLETAQTPGGMMTSYQQPYGNVGNMMQGMTIQSTVASNPPTPPTPTTPQYQLSPEDDQQIMKPLENLLQWIIDSSRTQARSEKAKELRSRLKIEMEPRLAMAKLTVDTKQYLKTIAHFTTQGQFREAQGCLGQMARSSTDFSEISSFLPTLKSLFALAQH